MAVPLGPLDGTVGADSWQLDLLAPFLQTLPISGISISVIGGARRETTICVSDVLAGRIDELQYSLGEGPHWASLSRASPTMVANVVEEIQPAWPMFAESVRELGVGALFSFPLTLGVAVVGVVDMYRVRPGAFTPHNVDSAVRLAASASATAVQRAMQSADLEPRGTSIAPELRREVQQATGMILVQLDVTAAEALLRIKGHAYSTGRSVDQVAHDVVTRRLVFRDLE